MLFTKLILDKLLTWIFLLFGGCPWGDTWFAIMIVGLVNELPFVINDVEPEVSSFLPRNRLKKVILADLLQLYAWGRRFESFWLFGKRSGDVIKILITELSWTWVIGSIGDIDFHPIFVSCALRLPLIKLFWSINHQFLI